MTPGHEGTLLDGASLRLSRRLLDDLDAAGVGRRSRMSGAGPAHPFAPRLGEERLAGLCPTYRAWSGRLRRAHAPHRGAEATHPYVEDVVFEWVAVVDRRRSPTGSTALGRAMFMRAREAPRFWCLDILVTSDAPGRLIADLGDGDPVRTALDTLEMELRERLVGRPGPEVLLARLLVVGDGTAPWDGEAPIARDAYHRLVVWHDEVPHAVDGALRDRLVHGLLRRCGGAPHREAPDREDEPWFGSYIAVVPRGRASHANGALPPPIPPSREPESHRDDPGRRRERGPARPAGLAASARTLLASWQVPECLVEDAPRVATRLARMISDRLSSPPVVEERARCVDLDRVPRLVRDHVRVSPTGADVCAVVRGLRFERVGWALGGGGAVSFRASWPLERLAAPHGGQPGVPVDLVAGSSAGALVAAVYAAGGVDGLASALEDAQGLARAVWRLAAGRRDALDAWIRRHAAADLGDLTVATYPIAVCLAAGEQDVMRPRASLAVPPRVVAFVDGDLPDAVIASGSAPPVLPPLVVRGPDGATHVFVDGGLHALVPCDALPALGADFVIGVSGMRVGGHRRIARRFGSHTRGRGAHALASALTWLDAVMGRPTGSADAYLAPPGEPDLALLGESLRFGSLRALVRDWTWSGLDDDVAFVRANYDAYRQGVPWRNWD